MWPLESWQLALAVGTGLAVYLIVKPLLFSRRNAKNPLLEDSRLPIKPLEIRQKERDAVLKQGFKPEYAREHWDAVVVGSGIGGLCSAALLSRSGLKVLVLEQHDQAGGACHTFIDKGYEFDVGIHYIGEMGRQTLSRTLLEQISNGQIVWDPLEEDYDVVVVNALSSEQREYKIPSGRGKWRELLKQQFPREVKGIDEFFSLIQTTASNIAPLFVVKILPYWIVKPLAALGIFEKFFTVFQINQKTVQQVAKNVTSDKELQLLLCYIWGTYATPPSQAGFPMQALLIKHFEGGAYYPRGGASEIAKQIIPVIEASGGRVCVRSPVREILLEGGRVAGVAIEKFGSIHKVLADVVVSDAGVHNTLQKLLNPEIAKKSRLWTVAERLKPGIGCVSIFIGLNASNEQLGLRAQNVWALMGDDAEEDYHKFNESSIDEALDKDYPFIFIGFPSAKDSSWKERYPDRSTVTVVTFAPWEWFEKWKGMVSTKRGDDYDGIKNTLGHRVVQQVCKLFPNIEKHVDYVSVGTPLSNEYYLAAHQGAIYGLDHPLERYESSMAAILRPETDIPGLYLSGQDLISSGFVSALFGGLLCAGSVLNRNLYADLVTLHKKVKSTQKKPA